MGKSKNYKNIVAANKEYAKDFVGKEQLPIPPAKKIAILTCMDARIEPFKLSGLSLGDAHIIRNAGGRATNDAIRSLIISHKLLGTQDWFIIHHTSCGMQLFTNDIMGDLLEESLHTAEFDGKNWFNPHKEGGTNEGKYINWHTIADQEKNLLEDIERVRNHVLVPSTINISGFVYDVKTGELKAVE